MKNKKLIRKFAYIYALFIVFTMIVAGFVTYFSQQNLNRYMCISKIKQVGDYLEGLILDDPQDFLEYVNYYSAHYEDIRIPVDFKDCYDAKTEFYRAYGKEFPGKAFRSDVMPDELPLELQNLFYTFKHEYWILAFEQARDSFDLPYTYFLLCDEDTNYVMYMIDGERTEDKDHPGYLYMGDSYYEEPSEHELMWNTYINKTSYDDVYEWDNEWGNVYSYYTPVVIDGECIGLVVSEIDVKYVNGKIIKNTLLLTLQLGLLLIAATSILLVIMNRKLISRILHLSDQIDDFSTKRSYETEDAIRSYTYGGDEIAQLAGNTADMIRQLRIHEEKIAQQAQYKSDFLANMSHELRTPMNAIVGLSELVLKEELTEKGREYSNQINSSASSLIAVFDDILDFSKIEAGTMTITPSDYNVRKSVEMVVSNQSIGLRDKPVTMGLNIADDVPEVLNGDISRIRQVLGNVISNAVKFTKEGSVTIDVSGNKIDEDNFELIIKVSDTGIGIKKEDCDKIFESFSQIDSKRNREVDGTGLGLAITRRLMNLMGGSVEVDSEFGEGSTFILRVPQKISHAVSPAKEEVIAREHISAPDAAVLVVDDNSINRYVAKNLLNEFDITPAVVPSGELAIKACGRKRFDLILMDYMMPQMDGLEATHRIRELYPEYKDIPVIAFTADAVAESREKLLSEGMDDFLAKPVKVDELEAMLKKWLKADLIK